MQKILKLIVFIAVLLCADELFGQADNNILLYNNQATLFGDQGPANDPISIIIPGTAAKSGIGSFIDNPATMALFNRSIGELGLSFGNITEDAAYLSSARSEENSQFDFSNIGFLHSFPTERGSLVFGAAYTKHSTFNRALSFRARNENSSITDLFKTEGSPYQEIAFNTFATDYGDEFQDWDESIFRIGFDEPGDYLGIRQQGEIFQSGRGGEYSLFFATEFQQNLMIGASIGLISGKFEYERIFQEIDEFNDYSSDIIDSDDDGIGETDIDNIILDDNLISRYNGFRARAGLLYKVTKKMNIGFSYTLPTKLYVDEEFDASITTTFDNSTDFSDFTDSDFTYNVKYPGLIAVGAALQDISGFSASFSAEYTDYSDTEIEFEESELFEDEIAENDFISDTYQSVWRYRIGAEYDLSPELTLRGGYRFQPSRFEDGIDDRSAYLLGAGFSIGNGIRLETAAEYTTWDEQSAVYDYGDYNYSTLPENLPEVSFKSEVADRTVDRWRILATIRINI